MNNTLRITVAFVAGLVGALFAHYVVLPVAFAQNQSSPKELRSQNFTLLDSSDHAVGTFTYDRRRRVIVLKDSEGRELWSAGNQILPLTGGVVSSASASGRFARKRRLSPSCRAIFLRNHCTG